jgi:hypothetical protein
MIGSLKQKDIILIIVSVFVAGVLSLAVSKLVFSAPKNRQSKVEVVQKITSDFPQPDSKFFNASAVDPTKLIQIGETQNLQPFGAD